MWVWRERKKKGLEEGAWRGKGGDEVPTTQGRRTERAGGAAHAADKSSADRALSGTASEHDRTGAAAQRGALRRVVSGGARAGTSDGATEAFAAQPAIGSGGTDGGGRVVARAMESRASERISAPGSGISDQPRNDRPAHLAGSAARRNPARESARRAPSTAAKGTGATTVEGAWLGNGRSRSGRRRWKSGAGSDTGRSIR